MSLAAWALAVGLLSTPGAARAELVVFADGGFLEVAAYEVEGDRVRLDLHSGGRLTMPLVRVERFLEDEVSTLTAIVDAPAGFSWAFDASHPVPSVPYGDLIHATAGRHGLNPALLVAVARAESAFAPEALSHKGARGLMQLMPATAARFGLEGDGVLDPARNLDAGARYLAWLLDRFDGDVVRALAGYNAGEGTVDRYGGVPPYRETQGYVKRICAELGIEPASPSPATTVAAVGAATASAVPSSSSAPR